MTNDIDFVLAYLPESTLSTTELMVKFKYKQQVSLSFLSKSDRIMKLTANMADPYEVTYEDASGKAHVLPATARNRFGSIVKNLKNTMRLHPIRNVCKILGIEVHDIVSVRMRKEWMLITYDDNGTKYAIKIASSGFVHAMEIDDLGEGSFIHLSKLARKTGHKTGDLSGRLALVYTELNQM